MHRPARQNAVRPGQVDVLEDATLRGWVGEPGGPNPVGVDGQQLAGLDFADERGADDVERGGFGGDDPATVQPTQRKRPHAVRVAGSVEGVLVHERQAEGAAYRRQQLEGGLLKRRIRGAVCQQCTQDVGVRGRDAGHLGADQPGLAGAGGQLGGVDEVAVVAERDTGARGGVAEHRLGVLPGGGAGCRVTAVPDRDVAFHGGQGLLVEHLADQAQVFEHQHLGAVGDGDPGSLLPAVLQCVEAVVGELGNVLAGCPDAEYAALFAGGVFHLGLLAGHDRGCSLGRGWLTLFSLRLPNLLDRIDGCVGQDRRKPG